VGYRLQNSGAGRKKQGRRPLPYPLDSIDFGSRPKL
jgi:hypothetical protein